MEVRTEEAPLKGFGAPPKPARLEIATLNTGDRLRRAGTVLGLCLLVAVIALPIPVVHLLLVPAALLLGVVLFAVRLTQREVLRGVHGTCAFCGTEQDFPVMGRPGLPRTLHCARCGRELVLGG